ncbi:DUF1847 domain-containing protein [Oscillibacter sp.]|uniref:DUF1847 domain-containing protein n=1 Tax=Oscillibacter sp. TaxID=1945593 RepID=UPI00289A33B3|nr:DUF1847 domain-containing protein [Oscillibacter sp.]
MRRAGVPAKSEEKYPKFCLTAGANPTRVKEVLEIYQNDEESGEISRVSACIEGEFYGRLTREEETVEFIKRMHYKKIGIASCVICSLQSRQRK